MMLAVSVALLLAVVQTQADPRPLGPDTRRWTLLQMSVQLPPRLSPFERKAAANIFTTDTRKFRTCGDALRLAQRYKAEKRFVGQIVSRPNVPVRSLPPVLQADLLGRPIGRASKLIVDADRLRVVIACTAPTLPKAAPDRSV